MESVRCIIAEMPHQQLLADIVQNMAEQSGVIEVVDRVDSIEDITPLMARRSADVLIMGMSNAEVPSRCAELMDRVADLPIVSLVDDGRKLAVYLNNIGKNDILRIIRALMGNCECKSDRENTF